MARPAPSELEHLKTSVANFRKVLALNGKLNSTLDLEELLGIIMKTAEEVMRAEAASLMLLDEETNELVFKVALGEKGGELKEKFRVRLGEGIAGACAQSGESLVINDPRNDARFAGRFDDATGFQTTAILCVPMRADGKIIGILEAMNPIGRKGFSADDLSLFETFADQAAIALQNARLHSALVEQELSQRELKIAREIQQSFLPETGDLPPGIDVHCYNLPAREVSGDFYDLFKFDEAKLGILIGDVSGKGVPASLYMVRAISDARFIARRTESPSDLLEELNARLARDSRFGIFTTLLCLLIDLRKNTLLFASAGHHPILRCRAEEPAKFLDCKGGVPVGLLDRAEYPVNEIAIAPGDVFLLYTDGITEARNLQGEEYSTGRLTKILRSDGGTAREQTERILADLNVFTKGATQHDDMTLVAIRIPKNA
jgi:sigma-B regulation protein RsbU (phosphoserine phosphatase)